MDKLTVFQIVRELPFDCNKTVFKNGNFEIYLFRPSRLSNRFKDHDVKKNFQIWFQENGRKFRSNHLRFL